MRASEKQRRQEPSRVLHIAPVFKTTLEITKATHQRLQREWPWEDLPVAGAPIILQSMLASSLAGVRCIRHLGFTAPTDGMPHGEAWLALLPMARSILEVLASAVFFLDDIPARTRTFLQAGWRFKKDMNVRLHEEWKARKEKADALQAHGESLRQLAIQAQVSKEHQSNPKKIPYWPLFGQMRGKAEDPKRNVFLKVLYDTYYAELSSAAHSSWFGIAAAQALLEAEDKEEHQLRLRERWSPLVLAFHLMTLGEINACLGFRDKRRTANQLEVLGASVDEIEQLRQKRYAALLA